MSARPVSVSVPGRRFAVASRALIFYGACTVIAAVFLFPLVWAVLTSLKPAAEASASPPTWLPSTLSVENYRKLAGFGAGIGRYLLNSIAVSAMTVAGTALLSTLAGYGFSRFRFRGKNLVFVGILATLMIPFQTIVVPLFVVLREVGLNNSLVGLALVYMTFQLPFGIFMMRNTFDNIPRELEEAALVDGCGVGGALWRVMLPLVVPGLVTVILFAFLAAWNEFFAALILLSDVEQFTLPIMLLSAQVGNFGTVDWGALQAGVTITTLPVVVLFLILQRYYINGLVSGAVKA
jgi:multiple sugar transport system permease protein